MSSLADGYKDLSNILRNEDRLGERLRHRLKANDPQEIERNREALFTNAGQRKHLGPSLDLERIASFVKALREENLGPMGDAGVGCLLLERPDLFANLSMSGNPEETWRAVAQSLAKEARNSEEVRTKINAILVKRDAFFKSFPPRVQGSARREMERGLAKELVKPARSATEVEQEIGSDNMKAWFHAQSRAHRWQQKLPEWSNALMSKASHLADAMNKSEVMVAQDEDAEGIANLTAHYMLAGDKPALYYLARFSMAVENIPMATTAKPLAYEIMHDKLRGLARQQPQSEAWLAEQQKALRDLMPDTPDMHAARKVNRLHVQKILLDKWALAGPDELAMRVLLLNAYPLPSHMMAHDGPDRNAEQMWSAWWQEQQPPPRKAFTPRGTEEPEMFFDGTLQSLARVLAKQLPALHRQAQRVVTGNVMPPVLPKKLHNASGSQTGSKAEDAVTMLYGSLVAAEVANRVIADPSCAPRLVRGLDAVLMELDTPARVFVQDLLDNRLMDHPAANAALTQAGPAYRKALQTRAPSV